MRCVALSALLLLAACPRGGRGNDCNDDRQCDGQVCARDNSCTDASGVREVKTTWTIGGEPANATSCADRDLYIVFQTDDSSDDLNFSPVPCATGQFVIDKLPTRYSRIELGLAAGGAFDSGAIDAANMVALDLQF
ncbi:MAG: hypothetical protein WKG01_37925 [Kofleriaceae bacterium]